MAEVSGPSQAQASNRAHDDGENPLGKARNNNGSFATLITGHVVDSDPEEGSGAAQRDEEHGLNDRYRFLVYPQLEVWRGLAQGEWMTDRQKRARMQNRIAKQNFRERKKRHFDDFEKSQDSSTASQSKYSTDDTPKPQSKPEEIPKKKTEEIRPTKVNPLGPLNQGQKDRAKSVRERGTSGVGSAGQGLDNEHPTGHSTDEDSEEEPSVQDVLGSSPPFSNPLYGDECLSEPDTKVANEAGKLPLLPTASFSGDEKTSSTAGFDLREAVDRLPEYFEWRHGCFPEYHLSRLDSQYELALPCQAIGEVKEAVQFLENVVASKRVLAEDDPDRLASQHSLAEAYMINGRVKEAIQLLKQIMAIKQKVLMEYHPARLASQHSLAVAYMINGQVKEAIQLLKQVVIIRRKFFWEYHPDRLAGQHSLAMAYMINGQVKEAIQLLEQVVVIRRKLLTEDHPDGLVSQYALAVAYSSKGQVREAIEVLGQAASPEQTSKSGRHHYIAGADTRKEVPVGRHPSHSLEESVKAIKRARNTTTRESRAKRRESIEQLEIETEAFQKGIGKDEEPGGWEESAMAENLETKSDLDQASMLTPRGSLVFDQQKNAQGLKYEIILDALYNLSRNVCHWTLNEVFRWLSQSSYSSQSILISTCNRMRGCRRISWTCECGRRAHWDLPLLTSDAKAAALLASLDRPSDASSFAADSNGQETSPSPSSSPPSQHSASDESHPSTPPTSVSENGGGDVCVDIPEGQEAESAQKPLMPRFIELCINSGRNKKIVAEIDLTEMKSDAEVFIAIADRYRQSRNGRGRVAVQLPQFLGRYMRIRPFECCFMRPSNIIFRKFIFYQHRCPEIAVCDRGLPPECEVSQKRYDYEPCPLEYDMIMPAHQFFHILDDPIPHTTDFWMQRLPKKLHYSLLSTGGQAAPISWGIHINETPNWYLIFMAVFLTLLASGVFSITWAAVTKDVQGAFGMGAYVVAVLTAGMTALFFKCSEDR